jgi:hypothetical protein
MGDITNCGDIILTFHAPMQVDNEYDEPKDAYDALETHIAKKAADGLGKDNGGGKLDCATFKCKKGGTCQAAVYFLKKDADGKMTDEEGPDAKPAWILPNPTQSSTTKKHGANWGLKDSEWIRVNCRCDKKPDAPKPRKPKNAGAGK